VSDAFLDQRIYSPGGLAEMGAYLFARERGESPEHAAQLTETLVNEGRRYEGNSSALTRRELFALLDRVYFSEPSE
jgi:hypothetical protein